MDRRDFLKTCGRCAACLAASQGRHVADVDAGALRDALHAGGSVVL